MNFNFCTQICMIKYNVRNNVCLLNTVYNELRPYRSCFLGFVLAFVFVYYHLIKIGGRFNRQLGSLYKYILELVS